MPGRTAGAVRLCGPSSPSAMPGSWTAPSTATAYARLCGGTSSSCWISAEARGCPTYCPYASRPTPATRSPASKGRGRSRQGDPRVRDPADGYRPGDLRRERPGLSSQRTLRERSRIKKKREQGCCRPLGSRRVCWPGGLASFPSRSGMWTLVWPGWSSPAARVPSPDTDRSLSGHRPVLHVLHQHGLRVGVSATSPGTCAPTAHHGPTTGPPRDGRLDRHLRDLLRAGPGGTRPAVVPQSLRRPRRGPPRHPDGRPSEQLLQPPSWRPVVVS